MKIVEQDAEILFPESPMKHIEKIGRICYKSEDKIADGTDRKFVSMLHNNGHHAMLEHYRFIMQVNPTIYEELAKAMPGHVEFSSYSDRLLISMNARALMELHVNCKGTQFGYLRMAVKGIRDELITHIIRKYDCYELFGWDRDKSLPPMSTGVYFIENNPSAMSEEEWNIHGWMSVHMITDRGISHEIVRHREETSFAQESTRYCNYGKGKFGGDITFIDQGLGGNDRRAWSEVCEIAEDSYFRLTNTGVRPEWARSILPTCLKTEIVMTAPLYEWEHFFDLRMRGTTGRPHPLIKVLSQMIYTEYIEEVMRNATNKN